MPTIGLAGVDADDLINYLETQNARLEAAEASPPSASHDHQHHEHHHGENHEHHEQ